MTDLPEQVTQKRARRAALTLLAGLVFLTGCGLESRVFHADQFLGQPLSSVYQQLDADPENPLPANFGYVLYDLTGLATGRPATGGSSSLGQPPSDWIVVVSCATTDPGSERIAASQTLVLGVVNKAAATDAVVAKARHHGFDSRVSECAGAVPTVSLPDQS